MRASPAISDAFTMLCSSGEPIVVPQGMTEDSPGTAPAVRRNTKTSRINESRTPPAPLPPVIAGRLLTGPQLSFLAFLRDKECKNYCELHCGEAGTAISIMLTELRNAKEWNYFGVKTGKLTRRKVKTKPGLKKYARRAYRGDSGRRPVEYWERIARLVWDIYDDLMKKRRCAEKIKHQEIKRLANVAKKRAARAAYMRDYRKRQKAKLAQYFKEEAKQQWREQRAH